MLCRLEKTKDWREVLVVDELDVYRGTIHLGTFFKHCLERKEILEMDEYTYYYANKEKLIKYLNLMYSTKQVYKRQSFKRKIQMAFVKKS